jgi:Fe-S-cluster containining protein
MRQLAVHRHGQACAFLVDQVCSIHPLRPMACRQFNVFNTVCAEGEDTYYTRRGDVMTPLKKYTHQAFVGTMPFYGIKTRARAREVVQSGMQHQLVKDLQNIDWRHLADKMKEYDRLR